jgi:hypothetical protein
MIDTFSSAKLLYLTEILPLRTMDVPWFSYEKYVAGLQGGGGSVVQGSPY